MDRQLEVDVTKFVGGPDSSKKIALLVLMLFMVALSSHATAQMTVMIPAHAMTCVPNNPSMGPDGVAHEYAPYEVAWDGQNRMIIRKPGSDGLGSAVNVERVSEKIALMQSSGGAHGYAVMLDFQRGSAAYNYGRVDKCIIAQSDTYVPEFDRFPAQSAYSGKPKMPDFNGKDRKYREYRNRIREGLAKQPRANFAGRFNLIDISVTGGVQIAIVESPTGRVKWLGLIEGPWPGLDYAFRENSRLLVSQSSNGERCWIDNYLWTGTKLEQLGDPVEHPIDAEGSCRNQLPNSAR